MRTKHVQHQIEAYLDQQLSLEERRRFENHLARCRQCTDLTFKARRIANEIKPVLNRRLGQPNPPVALREQIRQRLANQQRSTRFSFSWATSGRILNALGTAAVVALMAIGLYALMTGLAAQPAPPGEIQRARPSVSGAATLSRPTATAIRPAEVKVESTPQRVSRSLTSLKDTLPLPTPQPGQADGDIVDRPVAETQLVPVKPPPQVGPPPAEPVGEVGPELAWPEGMIAFAVHNPDRQNHEIFLIEADGSELRQFPLNGVSEPALRPGQDGAFRLAYRGWGEAMAPRALASNNLSGDQPTVLTYFWEDAQPDWSPTENRIIFASQRESDRRWRLYTVWEDGSAEVNLRREGKSPTFAPDGFRFAFESCESHISQTQCGLWQGDLASSELGSVPFLLDPLAKAPDWSPVGEEIAYMANPDGNWDIYLVNSDGNKVRRLTQEPANDGLPVWSPDGQWLAFFSDRAGQWGIWLLHLDSGQLRLLHRLADNPFNQPPSANRPWWDEQMSWSQ
jgi:TolB protein